MQPFHIHKTFLSDDDTEYPTYFPSNNNINNFNSSSSPHNNNNNQFPLSQTTHSNTIPQSTTSPQDTFEANNDSIEVIVSDLEYEIDQDNINANINNNTCSTTSSTTSTLIHHAKSTQNSFIKLNNKLRLSLERDSSHNTNSYLMALLDLDNDNCNDNKNYEVTSIIEEEEDIESNEKKIERHHTQSIQFKMISFGVGNSYYTNNKSYVGFHTKAKSELLQLKLNIDVIYTSETEEEKENIFPYN